METLHGAAKTTSTLKNIGKESRADGGMNEGLNTILLNTKAKSVIQTLDFTEGRIIKDRTELDSDK